MVSFHCTCRKKTIVQTLSQTLSLCIAIITTTQIKQGYGYLLVTELPETMFKLIVSGLCTLPQLLQYLQKRASILKQH